MMVNLAAPYNVATSAPRSKQLAIFYAPDQPTFLFDQGNTITIWLQAINRPLKLNWRVCRNLVDSPLLSGTCKPGFDESFKISIPTNHLLPGFYDLKVKVQLTEKESFDALTVFGWKATEEPLVPVTPSDFEPFWRTEKEDVDRIPLDLKVRFHRVLKGDEISDYNLSHANLPEHYDAAGEKHHEVEVYKIDFGASAGKRTYGWFAKPTGRGPFPGCLILPGAGNNSRPAPVEHARHGYAALDIQVHNHPADLPQKDYDPQIAEERLCGDGPRHYSHYWVYRNALQAVNALAELPQVDPHRLTVLGGSQGGRLATVVAALDPRIKAAIMGIAHFGYMPWLRWTEQLNRAQDAGNREFTPSELVHDELATTRSYFDTVNFARLIRCPVLMNAGLTDRVSPATSVFAIYRAIRSPKQIIPLPNLSHDWSPGFDTYAWKWLGQQWNNQ